MDPQIDVRRLMETVEENNRILKSMQRRANLAFAMGAIKWAIVLLFTLGAYYYIQPYLVKVLEIYSTVSDSSGLIQSSRDSIGSSWDEFKNLFGGGDATITEE